MSGIVCGLSPAWGNAGTPPGREREALCGVPRRITAISALRCFAVNSTVAGYHKLTVARQSTLAPLCSNGSPHSLRDSRLQRLPLLHRLWRCSRMERVLRRTPAPGPRAWQGGTHQGDQRPYVARAEHTYRRCRAIDPPETAC
jgi:hypothetical protein